MATEHMPDAPRQPSWPKREEDLLAFWREHEIFRKSVERDAPRGEFVFYEGPPTANAPPGIHHVESRTFKDVIPRYRTMAGYRVRRKAGWDTHGLPVELQIEKKLDLKTKRAIEQYGVAAFNAECRDSVWAFKAEWDRLTERIGFWLDLEDPYITYESSYIESVWWFLKQAHDRGLLSREYKSVWYCPRCQTPLSSHEVALGYEDDVEDPSVYVQFKIGEDRERGEPVYALAWTTTPWTLPANAALAIHPEAKYVRVRLPDRGIQLVLARARLSVLDPEPYEILGAYVFDDGIRYEWPCQNDVLRDAQWANARKVYRAPFVGLNDGTGIVHIAPAYGAEDSEFGREHGIPPLFSVDETGTMGAGLPGAGKFMKDADADVIADLRERGLLFREERVRHTYPFCWRCNTPLLSFARPSWYITMTKLRPQIQALNAKVGWHPEHIRDGRMGEWLRELKDWAITRERYWGAPIPIWRCDACGRDEVLGSFAELLDRAPKRNRFLLMRHGEAESNVHGVISSRLETSDRYPLTAEGERRVRATAERLQREGITRIIASPFHRMQQTAAIVSDAIGVPITTAQELREFNLADADGQPTAEYLAQFSRTVERFSKRIGANETWEELRSRMLAYLKVLDEQCEGETILVLTHGDNIWLTEWALSGSTRAGIDALPYPGFDNPHEFPFVGMLVNDRGEFDVHRPYIDAVVWPCGQGACMGTMHRYPEVADVWLESGAMPFAQHHFPFEWRDREGELPYPADFISEAIDQTRGWFYTLLAVASVLGKEQPPFRNCVVLGHLLDQHGKKMSKSKRNIVNPWDMIDRYGADVVRWYMLAVNQPWDPKLFDETDLRAIANKPFGTLRNILSFWELHGGGAAPDWSSNHVLDRWLRAQLRGVHEGTTQHLDRYEITEAARFVGVFIEDFSTWWLRRSRERLKAGDAAARATFTAALQSLAVLLAPFAPFHAEHAWQALRGDPSPSILSASDGSAVGGEGEGEGVAQSVHLASWDLAIPPGDGDAGLLSAMRIVRTLASLGLEAREQAGIPIRQPLSALRVRAGFLPASFRGVRDEKSRPLGSELLRVLVEELNVQQIRVDGALTRDVELDTKITPELQRAGMVRELTRAVNDIRKVMRLAPNDRIRVTYHTEDAELRQAIDERRTELERGTLSVFSPSILSASDGSAVGGEGERKEGVGGHYALTISSASISLDIMKA